jgi:hypothetical protein
MEGNNKGSLEMSIAQVETGDQPRLLRRREPVKAVVEVTGYASPNDKVAGGPRITVRGTLEESVSGGYLLKIKDRQGQVWSVYP